MASTYCTLVNLRIDRQLKSAAHDKAQKEGTTFSALVRQALKRELEDAR
jgi:antitoxin component of RelBE/YafQ-DinJ toxin-antitoxin module